MPAVLPAAGPKRADRMGGDDALHTAPYLQGISFFVVGLLLSAWAVKDCGEC